MAREINIPFGGFYESMWSDILDRELEMIVENDCNDRQREDGIPTELQLDERTYSDALFYSTDYRAGEIEIARDYVDALNAKIKDELGLDLGLKFKTMESPREYNFTTDRLFSDISLKACRRMLAYSRKLDNHGSLNAKIAERHTSRSGFVSFYGNAIKDWLAKPIDEWDHNELGTLLRVIVDQLGDNWEWDIYECLSDHSYDYADKAVDWQKYQAKIDDARAELESELRADDPDYVEPAYRCPRTIDMFTGRAGLN